jgi:hypothetical protein
MAPMSDPETGRTVRVIEDAALLAAAALLAVWAFSDRSAAWTAVLGVAVVVLGVIFVRRLAGWIRAGREPPEQP